MIDSVVPELISEETTGADKCIAKIQCLVKKLVTLLDGIPSAYRIAFVAIVWA